MAAMEDIVCDDKDREYLRKIRKEYKNLVRNIWNPFDKNHEKILGLRQLIDCISLLLRCFSLSICPYQNWKYF